MTSFFDDASRASNEVPRTLSDEEYLRQIAVVEEPVVKTVLLNTGDREFPDDLRERALNLIATRGIYSPAGLAPTAEARDYVLSMRYSQLVADLHSVFHVLAGRRVKTRFGFWSDSPRQNLVSRSDHDDDVDVEPRECID